MHLKIYIKWLLLFASIVVISFLGKLLFSQKHINTIYIVTRGTQSGYKSNAKKLNYSHDKITHIGIGVYEKNNLIVYSIMPTAKEGTSALKIETFEDFINIEDIKYYGVWYTKVDKLTFLNLQDSLSNAINHKYKYDWNFDLNNDNYYCSEFVAKVLNNTKEFDFKPVTMKANDLIKNILNRDVFEYYPADFFLQTSLFKLQKEKYY